MLIHENPCARESSDFTLIQSISHNVGAAIVLFRLNSSLQSSIVNIACSGAYSFSLFIITQLSPSFLIFFVMTGFRTNYHAFNS